MSAGLKMVGFSLPETMSSAAASEPRPTRVSSISGCALRNEAAADSIHSFFSVLYSMVMAVVAPALPSPLAARARDLQAVAGTVVSRPRVKRTMAMTAAEEAERR